MSQDSWNPTQYDKFKKERSQPFFDLMNLLRPMNHAEVIDLGCGTGELTAELHKHLKAQYTHGMDSSAEMLSKAKVFESSSLSFAQSDIETWSAAEKYDVVFSNAALQWCSNHHDLFLRLKKSLRPHGQLAVQMPMNHDYPTHTLAAQMAEEKPWADLLKSQKEDRYVLTCEEYAKLLFQLGFKEQTVFLKVYAHVFESRESVIEWVQGTMLTRFKSRLSTENYNNFVREYRERLFQQLADEKPFFYPFKRVLMWAQL